MVPVGLQLGRIKLYLVGDPDQVKKLFKPTPAISSNVGAAIAIKSIFGTPDHIVSLYSEDNSGRLPIPNPGSQVRLENRIVFLHSRTARQHLAGIKGSQLGERYLGLLSRNISADTNIQSEWLELPDLFVFIQKLVFFAATETICGSSILSLNPTLFEDFWKFYQSIPVLLKSLPRWLCPEAYRRRDRMLIAMKRWHAFASNHSDYSKTGPADPEWDCYFGSKYVKARHQFFNEIEVMNADGIAADDLGLLFA